MVFLKVNDKPVKFKKIKGLAKKVRAAGGRVIQKAKEARKPEVQLAKIKAKQEILTAKTKLRQQRIGLAQQKAKLRGQQLKATGINVPKFVRGTQRLGAFASGNGFGFKSLDMGEVLGGGQQQAPPISRKFKTVTKNIRIKTGKRKGKFRAIKKRIAIRQALTQPKAFNPYDI